MPYTNNTSATHMSCGLVVDYFNLNQRSRVRALGMKKFLLRVLSQYRPCNAQSEVVEVPCEHRTSDEKSTKVKKK